MTKGIGNQAKKLARLIEAHAEWMNCDSATNTKLYDSAYDAVLSEFKALQSRVEALEKDAARYQLRLETIRALYPSAPSDSELDIAIGAAMQSEKGGV